MVIAKKIRLVLSVVLWAMLFTPAVNAQTLSDELKNPYLDMYISLSNVIDDDKSSTTQMSSSDKITDAGKHWIYYTETVCSIDDAIALRQAEIKGKACFNDMVKYGVETALKDSNKGGSDTAGSLASVIMYRLNYTLTIPATMTELKSGSNKWEARVIIGMVESIDEFKAMLKAAFDNEDIYDTTMQVSGDDDCRKLSIMKVIDGMFTYHSLSR